MGKVLTGPWMRMLSGKNILDLNPIFAEIKQQLKQWAKDASPLLQGDIVSCVPGVPVLKDSVLKSLVEPTTFQEDTQALLQELCRACVSVMERQLTSQLPGGKFWNPSEELINQARSCEATNISGERVFAMSDQLMARAHSAQISHVESKVCIGINNATCETSVNSSLLNYSCKTNCYIIPFNYYR